MPDPNQLAMPAMNPMTPDNQGLMLNYLMQQGGAAQQQQELAKKQALIQQLRQDTALPGMIQGGGARTVKAAHPLSAIADIGGKLIGGYKQKGLDAESAKVTQTSRDQLADLIKNTRKPPALALPGTGAMPEGTPGIEIPQY